MHKKSEAETSLSYAFIFLLCTGGTPGLQLLEEVVALVIHQNECGEVFHINLPHGLHAQFGIFHTLDALDAAL